MASDSPIKIKAPAAKIPYTFDWTEWLAALGQTISSRTTTVPPGLTRVGSDVVTPQMTTVTVTGGKVGRDYPIVDHIVTTPDGIEQERTLIVKVRKT